MFLAKGGLVAASRRTIGIAVTSADRRTDHSCQRTPTSNRPGALEAPVSCAWSTRAAPLAPCAPLPRAVVAVAVVVQGICKRCARGYCHRCNCCQCCAAAAAAVGARNELTNMLKENIRLVATECKREVPTSLQHTRALDEAITSDGPTLIRPCCPLAPTPRACSGCCCGGCDGCGGSGSGGCGCGRGCDGCSCGVGGSDC